MPNSQETKGHRTPAWFRWGCSGTGVAALRMCRSACHRRQSTPINNMFGSFLPSLWSQTTQSVLGSRGAEIVMQSRGSDPWWSGRISRTLSCVVGIRNKDSYIFQHKLMQCCEPQLLNTLLGDGNSEDAADRRDYPSPPSSGGSRAQSCQASFWAWSGQYHFPQTPHWYLANASHGASVGDTA